MKSIKIITLILKNEFRNKQAVLFSLFLPILLLILCAGINKSSIGYLYPGTVAIAFGTMGVVGVSSQLTGYIDSELMKRILITDISLVRFILLDYLAQIIFMSFQLLIITLVSIFVYGLKFNISNQFVWIELVNIILAMLALSSIGTLVAGIVNNQKTSSTVSNAIMTIMLFLGNTLFPVEGWPKLIVEISKVLPMYQLTTSMRSSLIMNSQTWHYSIIQLIGLLLVFLICMVTGILFVRKNAVK